MKKILGVIVILGCLNILVIHQVSNNSDRDFNLNELLNIALAESEDPYPNGLDGDSRVCAFWQPSCQCYIDGCYVWCMGGGYHCEETQCGYGLC